MDVPLAASPDQSNNLELNSSNAVTKHEAEDKAKRESPVTLLQMRDGSMYGLTEYWIEGEELHYLTTYGSDGSVRIRDIDFEQTAKLNADRGVDFVLRPRPAEAPR